MRKRRFRARVLLLLLVVSFAAWIWWMFCGGVSHREVMNTVRTESESVRGLVDARADGIEARIAVLEAKVAAADAKLDRIESKLDRILDLAAPKLPDDMRPAPRP